MMKKNATLSTKLWKVHRDNLDIDHDIPTPSELPLSKLGKGCVAITLFLQQSTQIKFFTGRQGKNCYQRKESELGDKFDAIIIFQADCHHHL